MAWLDPRTTTGSLAHRAGFPESAGLDREGRRWHHHTLVRARRRGSTRTSSRPVSITGGSRAPTCWTGPSPWTTWRRITHRPRTTSAAPIAADERRCRPTTTTRCWRTVPSGSATTSTPQGPTAPTPNPMTAGRRRSRTGSISRATRTSPSGAPWSREIPQALATGKLDLRPNSHGVQITHDAGAARTRCSTWTPRATLQRQTARVVCVAGNAIETPRLLLLSGSAAVPRRAGELLRPGGPELHAAHHRLGVRAVREAGATCTAAKRWPG